MPTPTSQITRILSFVVETDGLFGPAFAVGGTVLDASTGEPILAADLLLAVDPEGPSRPRTAAARDRVLPRLVACRENVVADRDALVEEFVGWVRGQMAADPGTIIVLGDAWPTYAGFIAHVADCHRDLLGAPGRPTELARLHQLGSLLLAADLDPRFDYSHVLRDRVAPHYAKHPEFTKGHPVYDAHVTSLCAAFALGLLDRDEASAKGDPLATTWTEAAMMRDQAGVPPLRGIETSVAFDEIEVGEGDVEGLTFVDARLIGLDPVTGARFPVGVLAATIFDLEHNDPDDLIDAADAADDEHADAAVIFLDDDAPDGLAAAFAEAVDETNSMMPPRVFLLRHVAIDPVYRGRGLAPPFVAKVLAALGRDDDAVVMEAEPAAPYPKGRTEAEARARLVAHGAALGLGCVRRGDAAWLVGRVGDIVARAGVGAEDGGEFDGDPADVN